MKRIIKGRTYDTDTAVEVCAVQNPEISAGWWAMYQNRHGAFFEVRCDHDGETHTFAPLSDRKARSILEKRAPHLVGEYFGPFPEYGSAERRLTVRMPVGLARQIEATATARGQPVNRYVTRSLAWAVQHMRTMDQCAAGLANLSQQNEPYSESRIDALVDHYLVGFGVETAAKRTELADAFTKIAPPTDLSDRIRLRILRAS
jgi:hypothetical protein